MTACKLDKLQYFDTAVYGITAEEHSRGRDNIEIVKRMVDSRIKIIQYREKDKSMLEKYRQCIRIREITAEADAVLIINDHVDLALSVGADGIHIGQDDLPFKAVRALAGEDLIIGVSTHSPEQAQEAVNMGADYIGVGPLFRTYTKKDVCEPVGLEYLAYVAGNIPIPFVAIGGIKLHNIRDVRSKGARCISLVTEIVGAEDMVKVIKETEEILKA